MENRLVKLPATRSDKIHGLSVDVILYDFERRRFLQFLFWKGVFISEKVAYQKLMIHHQSIQMVIQAMKSAGFQEHDEPREKLQMHFRLADKSL